MRKAEPVYFWEADVEIVVRNLALSLQVEDRREGARTVRVFRADWLEGRDIYFNPAQRLKGWLKKQTAQLKPSLGTQVKDAVKVYPADSERDWIKIATVDDLQGSDKPLLERDYKLPEALEGKTPFWQHIQVPDKGGVRVATTYWYVLPKEITLRLKIVSFARGVTPEIIEELLRKLGKYTGIGDKHATGQLGLFELKRFEVRKERFENI